MDLNETSLETVGRAIYLSQESSDAAVAFEQGRGGSIAHPAFARELATNQVNRFSRPRMDLVPYNRRPRRSSEFIRHRATKGKALDASRGEWSDPGFDSTSPALWSHPPAPPADVRS
jgi:hypothetical protein